MGKSSEKLFCHIRRLEFGTLYPPLSHSAGFIKPTPMPPLLGRESRQVMSPSHDLLPAQLRTSLVQGITSHRDAQEVFATRVLSKELLAQSFLTPSRPEEGPSSQGSYLRTVQLESENSFTHLPSPQGVCHTAFFTQLQSLDSNEQAVRWEKPCNLHSTEPRVDHNITLQQLRLLSLYNYNAQF